MPTDDDALKLKIVTKLAVKKVTGAHKKPVDTVKNWLKSSDQGRGEDLIREMMRDPDAPLEAYIKRVIEYGSHLLPID